MCRNKYTVFLHSSARLTQIAHEEDEEDPHRFTHQFHGVPQSKSQSLLVKLQTHHTVLDH